MNSYSEYWWMFLIRGIFAIILGLLALLMPGPTLATLMIFFGAYILVDGIFSIIAGANMRKTSKGWGWFIFYGIIAIIAAFACFINPFVAAITLVYFIAAWALVAGVMEIVAAMRLRKTIKGEGWYILAGILNIVVGILFFMNPVAGGLTLTIIFGVYALLIGIMLIALSIRLKKHRPLTDSAGPAVIKVA